MRLILAVFVAVAAFAQTKVDWLHQVQNKPHVDAQQFTFTRVNGQNASGDLSASGSNKVVTFTSCPSGVGFGQYIKISGGTGTAEVTYTKSTTCTTNGGTSGTITIDTVNAHTGAWQITSASNGIFEAIRVVAADSSLPRTIVVRRGTADDEGTWAPSGDIVIHDYRYGNPHVWANWDTGSSTGEALLWLNQSTSKIASPGETSLTGIVSRVTSDTPGRRPLSLWGADFIVQQGYELEEGEHSSYRAAEFEVGNVGTSAQFQSNPFGGAAGDSSYRSNGIEITAIALNGYRNTAGLTVFSNTANNKDRWWDTGVALTRVARYGLRFMHQAQDDHATNGRDFSECAVCDESNSVDVLRVSGTHTNIINLGEGPTITNFVNGPTAGIGNYSLVFNRVIMSLVGPRCNGSGCEALFADVNGLSFVMRRNGDGNGTLELGMQTNHNLHFLQNNAVVAALNSGGTFGVGTIAHSVSGTGKVHFSGNTARIFDTTRTPATAAEACYRGEVAFDASYGYICIADNTWKRFSIATW
jgi:hypothetical protein